MRRSSRTAAWSALGLGAAFVVAQSFRESARVDLVRIDLVVLDSSGRPRADLVRADVEVLVDGKPVTIEGFEVPAPAAPKQSAHPPETSSPPSPSAGSIAAVAAVAVPAPYSMAFLVDETSTDASNRPAVYREIAAFFESPLPAETRVLLMRFNGELKVECPWTSDRDRLRGVLGAMSRHPSSSRLGTPGRTSGDGVAGAGGIQFEAIEAVARARKSMDAVFDGLRMFPDLPGGRKALYVVTDGAPFLTPYEISRDLIRGSASSVDPLDPDAARKAGLEADRDASLLLDSLAWDRTKTESLATDVARLALLRGVEIHPLRAAAHDLDGRIRSDRAFSDRADVGMGRPLTRRSQRAAEAPPMTDIAAGQGMEEMARTTGGEAVLSRRFVGEGLRRDVELRQAAYVLTFRDPFAGDHRFHRVEIVLAGSKGKGTELRYRRGYRILDVRESLTEASVDRLFVPADANPLGVRLQVDSLGVEKGKAVAEVTVAYPAPPAAPGGNDAPSTVQAVGFCAVRNGRLSPPFDLGGPAQTSRIGDAVWRIRSGRIELKPGAYRCSFAIRDDATEVVSYLAFERTLP